MQDLKCTGMEKAAAALLHLFIMDHSAKKLTTDVEISHTLFFCKHLTEHPRTHWSNPTQTYAPCTHLQNFQALFKIKKI